MKFLSNSFTAAALLFFALAFYHWWVGTYTNVFNIFVLLVVGVIFYIPSYFLAKKIRKSEPEEKPKLNKEIKEKPKAEKEKNDPAEINQLTEKSDPDKKNPINNEKSNKVGFFGAAIGLAAYKKASKKQAHLSFVNYGDEQQIESARITSRENGGQTVICEASIRMNDGSLSVTGGRVFRYQGNKRDEQQAGGGVLIVEWV